MKRDLEVSKLISYWLRHNPSDGNLLVDQSGWTDVSSLLKALKERRIELSLTDIEILNQSTDKRRWEFSADNNKIRATHGHSINISLLGNEAVPPDALFHGTCAEHLAKILEQGLLTMNRQQVHLSDDPQVALKVATRHGKPVLIELDSQELIRNGHRFFQSNENVWLTSAIDRRLISCPPWHIVTSDDDYNLLVELKLEVGRQHILHNILSNLLPLMRRYDRDDVLFLDKLSLKAYNVHLTYRGSTEINPIYPSCISFNSLIDWINRSLTVDQDEWYVF